MRIRLSQLEEARKNPKEFAKIINVKGKGRLSRLQVLKNSVFEYHKNGAQSAHERLELQFNNNFKKTDKNQAILENYINWLDSYIKSFENAQQESIEANKLLSIDVENSNQVTGKGPIVSYKGDKYYVIYLSNNNTNWTSELRFPLLQHYYSNSVFKCQLENVYVGTYDFSNDTFTYISFNEDVIIEALNEVVDITTTISKYVE